MNEIIGDARVIEIQGHWDLEQIAGCCWSHVYFVVGVSTERPQALLDAIDNMYPEATVLLGAVTSLPIIKEETT